MTIKTTPAKLSAVQPTPEELAKARQVLQNADKQAILSKKQSLNHFLTLNPDAAANHKGPESQKWLETFVVHSFRCKDAAKTVQSSKTVASTKKEINQNFWWAAEEMDLNLGAVKGKALRDAKVLPTQPCPVVSLVDKVKASSEFLLQYCVPKNFNELSVDDIRKLMYTAQSETDADDLDAFIDKSAGSSTDVTVKKEPASASEVLALKIEQFKASLQQNLQKYSQMSTDGKMIKAKAEAGGNKYYKEFIVDLTAHSNKAKKLATIIERLMVEEFVDSEVPKILSQMDAIAKTDETLKESATKLGFYESAKRRKTKKGSD